MHDTGSSFVASIGADAAGARRCSATVQRMGRVRRAVGLALLGPLLIAGCGGDGAGPTQTTATFVPKEGPSAGPPRVLNPQPQPGPTRAVFKEQCGNCHTLAAAGAHGFVGPSLDDLRPTAAQVRTAIRNGGARNEVMPSNLLAGRDAARVARYVARVAGD